MRRIAVPIFVFLGSIFACGDDRDRFNGGEGSFDTDAGADGPVDPGRCEGSVRCARDLRSIVDGCDESKVIAECAPNEGCGDGRCVPACDAAVGANATVGCEFVPLPPPTESLASGSCFASILTNTWPTPARIEAEYGGEAIDVASFTRIVKTEGTTTTYEPYPGEIAPGQVAVIFLSESASGFMATPCPAGTTPAIRADTTVFGTRRGSTFRLRTTAPVSAYSVYPFAGASSTASTSTMLLPLASWNTDYFVTSPWEMRYFANTGLYPTTQVVAADDDTEITLVSSVHVREGLEVESAEKGVPKTYRLKRGEQIQFWQEADLTGSRIASNKPIGVWTGHQAMAIPTGMTCCGDSSQTALFPVRSWGREYPVVPYRSRRNKELPEDYLYRVTGAVEGTVLTYEPSAPKDAPTTLGAGQSFFFSTQEPFVVKSQDRDHPFAIYSYMTSQEFAGAQAFQGDPEFVPVVASEQYLGRYVFFVDTSHPYSQLVVVRSREEGKAFEPVTLDCAGELDGFAPLGTSGKYEFVRVWLTRDGKPQRIGDRVCGSGRHEVESRGPTAVTVWGTGPYASYGYPGGAALRPINAIPPIIN